MQMVFLKDNASYVQIDRTLEELKMLSSCISLFEVLHDNFHHNGSLTLYRITDIENWVIVTDYSEVLISNISNLHQTLKSQIPYRTSTSLNPSWLSLREAWINKCFESLFYKPQRICDPFKTSNPFICWGCVFMRTCASVQSVVVLV